MSTKIKLYGRLSFPNLFKPGAEEYGGKYGTVLLIPPAELVEAELKPFVDLAKVRAALKAAGVDKWGDDMDKWPKLKSTPATVIKNAAEKAHLQGYEDGWHFINLNSSERPGIVDGFLRDVTDEREAYPGRWAMVSGNAYAWANQFGKGVSIGLMNVQLRKHDDRFGLKADPKHDFDEWAEELPDAGAMDKPEPKRAAAGGGGWED